MVGVASACRSCLYQLWAFVSPGLTLRERRTALPWIPLTIVFFVLGVVVAYVTLPYAHRLPDRLRDPGHHWSSRATAEAYFGFVTMIFLIFGAVMEFPIVLVRARPSWAS